jgi:DNA-binding response OmpR family regulator
MIEKKIEALNRRCFVHIPKLLIIDDAINLSLFYTEEFRDEGYEVDVANSLSDACKLLTINSYDLMIVEINLKGKQDSDNLCTMLNSNIYDIPVILNTGTPLPELEKRFSSFKAYIEKSSDIWPLKEKVNDVITHNSVEKKFWTTV